MNEVVKIEKVTPKKGGLNKLNINKKQKIEPPNTKEESSVLEKIIPTKEEEKEKNEEMI